MEKTSIRTAVSLTAVLVLGCVSLWSSGNRAEETAVFYEATEEITTESASADQSAEECSIFVYVSGAVQTPGVYELSSGMRVNDAVEKAGGFTEEAAKESLNLAATLSDGMHIHVPSENEAFDNDGSQYESSSSKVNINTASKEELMTLTGVGEAKAEAILAYRQENGAFSSIEDIMNVSGIGAGIFEKIRDRIGI